MHTEIVNIVDALHLDSNVQVTAGHLFGAWDVVCTNSHKYHIDRGPAAAASVLFAGLDAGIPITSNDVTAHSSFYEERILTQEALMSDGMSISHSEPNPEDYAQEYIIRLDAQLELGLGSDAADAAADVAKSGRPYIEIDNWQAGAGAVIKATDVTIEEISEVAHCGYTPILGSLNHIPKDGD